LVEIAPPIVATGSVHGRGRDEAALASISRSTDSSTAPASTRALSASASIETTRFILLKSSAMPGRIVSAPPMSPEPPP
jgi:hypothetical protein